MVSPWIQHGAFALWPGRRLVQLDDRVVVLTPSEFAILGALLHAKGEPVSRQALEHMIQRRARSGGRSVDTHVHNLRRLLGDDGRQQRVIVTVVGAGYAIAVRLLQAS
jgi:two-component system, OmpR family, response regulator